MDHSRLDEILAKYKFPLATGLVGFVLLTGGVVSSGLFSKTFNNPALVKSTKFPKESLVLSPNQIKVDVAGAVNNPGVYVLSPDARIEQALQAAGGVSASADANYLSKSINLAQKISDGMKIYIPRSAEAGQSGTPLAGSEANVLVNVNAASVQELADKLPGVGEVTARSIISKRPYSGIEELFTKKAVNRTVYEKIKGLVSVY